MEYSPKLKNVINQIRKILKENDIAGVVVLHTPGFSEYLLHINTTYSCAHLNSEGIRIKTKGLLITKKKKQTLVRDTSNMFSLLSETTEMMSNNLLLTSSTIDRQIDAEHFDKGHSSNSTLEN